ncbi:hypothetical protein AURDEDRAFT_63550 [Auricularia subglabra TFB-10046 SS5]|nr:hypothetical protein AURDEDRAFT_63550 [Auricularia subglabra TFB-10046 SS5]
MSRPSQRGGSAPTYFSAYSTNTAYPSFISLPQALSLHAGYALAGLRDALRWDVVARHAVQDSEVRANLVKSATLNTVSLVSVYAFEWILLPMLRGPTQRRIAWAYQALWLLPLAGISLLCNARWCSAISSRVFTLKFGRANAAEGGYNGYCSVLNAAAASAYRFTMLATSVAGGLFLARVPIIGSPAATLFLCWVDSFYCFEYVWIARGMTLAVRIKHLEERWTYYLAFGLPITLSCAFLPTLPSLAVFALFLPAHIVMAHHARPVPSHPYTPLPPQGAEGKLLLPSPYVPVRVPVFAPAIWLNDWIVRAIGAGAGVRRRPPPPARVTSDIPLDEMRASAGASSARSSTTLRAPPTLRAHPTRATPTPPPPPPPRRS